MPQLSRPGYVHNFSSEGIRQGQNLYISHYYEKHFISPTRADRHARRTAARQRAARAAHNVAKPRRQSATRARVSLASLAC